MNPLLTLVSFPVHLTMRGNQTTIEHESMHVSTPDACLHFNRYTFSSCQTGRRKKIF